MFSVHSMWVSHITGHSRPLDKVGLAPRQYMEWNVVGHARSTADLSQQGLLPEVHCTACTKRCAHQNDRIPKNPGLCASPANGSRSHDCAPVMRAYGVLCPAMVSSHAGLHKEDELLYPDHHLIWCVESGFRPAHLKC